MIVKYHDIFLVACYISPNSTRAAYLNFLDDLGSAVRRLRNKTIICGNFNAKSPLWGGVRSDSHGQLVEEWAAELDLRLVNVGTTPTCIRPQGWSIIDLTWYSPDVGARISSWRIRTDMESLSDYPYISMELDAREDGAQSHGHQPPRWNWRSCNVDKFRVAISWEFQQLLGEDCSVEERAKKIRAAIQRACDVGAERVKPGLHREQVYWWSDVIAEARKQCIQRRRVWTRANMKNRDITLIRSTRDLRPTTRLAKL